MKLQYTAIESAFKDPFTISQGRTKTTQPALLVALSLGRFIGWGEAPAITYYDITVEQMIRELQEKKLFVEKFALTEPERYWHYLHHLFPKNPFLVCALDMACWDLFGQMKGRQLHQLWGSSWKELPPTDYTIGMDSIEAMVAKVQAKPWPVYKIKLGGTDDIRTLSAIRAVTDAPFRIDVNGGWSLTKALEMIPQLKALGVELVEQPLPRAVTDADWEAHKTLFASSELPLIADESCVTEEEVDKCQGYFDGINIKLTKCSGPTPAIRMIHRARELGLKVMMGSMNETAIGSAAIAQFLPQLDYADMDGTLLLEGETAKGLNIVQGQVTLGPFPGLGVSRTVGE